MTTTAKPFNSSAPTSTPQTGFRRTMSNALIITRREVRDSFRDWRIIGPIVTLTFLSLFLLMERPTITDWVFGFTRPESEMRWRPVVEDSIKAISSSLKPGVM